MSKPLQSFKNQSMRVLKEYISNKIDEMIFTFCMKRALVTSSLAIFEIISKKLMKKMPLGHLTAV